MIFTFTGSVSELTGAVISRLRLFRSRCIIGGLLLCKKCIPYATSIHILSFCGQLRGTSDFSWSSLNKLSPAAYSISIAKSSPTHAPMNKTKFGWRVFINISISRTNSFRLLLVTMFLNMTLTATSVLLYFPRYTVQLDPTPSVSFIWTWSKSTIIPAARSFSCYSYGIPSLDSSGGATQTGFGGSAGTSSICGKSGASLGSLVDGLKGDTGWAIY